MNQPEISEKTPFKSGVLFVLGVCLVTGSIQLLLLWGWSMGQLSGLLAFVLHGLCCTLVFALTRYYRAKSNKAPLIELLFLFLLVLGPVGALCLLLSAFLYLGYRRKATPFEKWYREIMPEYITQPEERLIERLMIWGEEAAYQHHDPVPFADILSAGNQAEKRAVLTLMLRNYHPSFAAVFLNALKDSDSAIRVQAASAITRIEENFLAENIILEGRQASHPDDLNNLLKLAQHYDERATAGLSDAKTLSGYRERAESLYQYMHEKQPKNTALLWSWGRLLIRAGKFTRAAQVFEKALVLTGDLASPLERVWYWECLYEQGRYAELRLEIKKHRNQIPKNSLLPRALVDSIALWARDDSGRIAEVNG